MSTTNGTTLQIGTRVRIASPYVRDYGLTETVG